MTSQVNKVTGIILAGGQSKRMGKDKGLLLLNDQPLINYPLKVMKLLCTEILISSNSSSYDFLGYKVIPDLYPGTGPMGGILSCLVQSDNEINFVIGCDMPFITADIFRQLILFMGDARLSVPWHGDDHYEPISGVYRKSLANEMQSYMDKVNFKLPDFFKTTSFKALPVKEIHPALEENYFFNINNETDLAKAELMINRLDK